MGLFDNWPYSDVHQLNLDWILKTVKDVKDKTDEIDAAVETSAENANAALESANDAAQSALNAESTLGTLREELGAWEDESADLINQVNTNTQNISVNSGRIDTFTSLAEGSTTGDAELMDIRVGADGVTYPTAGDAVRAQVTDLNERIDEISSGTYNLIVAKKEGYSIGNNGKINANATTDMYSAPVEAGVTYYVTTNDSSLIFGYFTSDPFAPDAVSYNASRTIQNPRYVTAPISGFIAFRTLHGYQYAQISEGNTELPYIRPVTAIDEIARQKADEALAVDYDAFNLYEGKYANVRNLVLSDLAGMKVIEFPVFYGAIFDYSFTLATPDSRGLYFEDAYGAAFGPIAAASTTQRINVPSSAVKCYATVTARSQVTFIETANTLLAKNNAVYTSGLTATNTPLEIITDTTGMLDLFLNVGCIGDSLASGEAYWNDGGTVQGNDFYEYSWGQFLARKTGNTYYNWSRGGLSTLTWLQSNYATECFDGQHKCEAYIIGLGQNDRNAGMTIGTSADINLSDYTQNANTFYGNYGKIIQKIQELQPQAKIFVITDPNPYVNRDGYNAPIRDMANIFSNVYVIDMFTYGEKFYNNPIISAQMRGGHYNAYGYKMFSMMIANYIDWIVTHNYTEFTQVELIGTGHSWI